MSKKKTEFSYDAAMLEIQNIVADLQNEHVGVDALAEKVQHAAYLIKMCRDKLRQTETDVQTALNDFKV
ncbi:MAG: exodeoxyribonuclease VII small subunit [Saprospiraceae bacterium]|nr:exodeoxyribonuclease VII small subunit [Saprospiraceae bacterium]